MLTSPRVLVDRYPTVVGMVVTMTVRVRLQRRWSPDLLLVPGDRDPVDAAVAIHACLARDRLLMPLEHELFHMLYDVREFPQIPSIGFWLGTRGATSERGFDSAVPHARAIFDDHRRIMVLITYNTMPRA